MIRLFVPEFNQCVRYKCARRLAQSSKSDTCIPLRRNYAKKSTDCPPDAPKGATGTKVTLSLLVIGTAATIGYAKYDDDFRKFLTKNVPYSDETIRFIFQEDKSFLSYGSDAFRSAVDSVYKLAGSLVGSSEEAPPPSPPKWKEFREDVIKPEHRPIVPAMTDCPPLPELTAPSSNETEIEKPKTEVAGVECAPIEPLPENLEGRNATLQKPVDRPAKYTVDDDTSKRLDNFNPKNLLDVENMIRSQINAAINHINKSIKVIREYNKLVEEVVITSADKKDDALWQQLKKKTVERDEILAKSNSDFEESMKNVSALKTLLKEPRIMGHVKDESRKSAEKRVKRLDADVEEAKKALEQEVKLGNVTEQYWSRVKEARRYFQDEFHNLLPDVDIKQQHLKIESSPELDLFLTQIRNRLLYYQTELTKMETLYAAKIQHAIEEAEKRGDVRILEKEQMETGAMYNLAVLRRSLQEEFNMKQMQIKREMDKDLKEKLKQQACIMQDLMKENLASQEEELKKFYSRELSEKLTKEKFQYKEKLAAHVGKIKAIDDALKATEEAGKESLQTQKLWQSCQALIRSLSAICPGTEWKKQLRPLTNEICAIKQIADDDDVFVRTVLSSIPIEAMERGVYPEEALRERFLTVEKAARNLALIPASGASLLMYFMSYFQNLLLIKNASPIPQAELDNEVVDFSELDTYDILQRARYWMDRGNFVQALKYMNLLKGASRCIAKDWMNEVRITLETQQAANVLMAHAVAQGLQYM